MLVYWRASVASETLSGVTQSRFRYNWRASVARNVFLQKKHGFLGLTLVYSETTGLSKPYFILKFQSVRKFLRKCLLFKKQKVDSTGHYGIEDPFPDLISKLRRFMGGYGVPVVGCQELLVVRMP